MPYTGLAFPQHSTTAMPQTQLPRKQHLISSTVRKAWMLPGTRQLAWHNLEIRQVPAQVTGCGGARADFIAVDHLQMEQRWAAIEEHIPELVAAVAGTGSLTTTMEDIARQVIALHWARSRTPHELEKRLAPLARSVVIEDMIREQPELLVRAFQQQFGGLVPVGPEALRYFAEHHLQPDPTGMHRSFRDRVIENFDTVLADLANRRIYIWDAAAGSEFLLSDIGVLTVSSDSRVAGPLYGVTWLRAEVVIMPLGPDVMIATGSIAGRRSLTVEETEKLNTLMVQSSVRHVAHRPGASCTWIDATWQARPRRLQPATATTGLAKTRALGRRRWSRGRGVAGGAIRFHSRPGGWAPLNRKGMPEMDEAQFWQHFWQQLPRNQWTARVAGAKSVGLNTNDSDSTS